MAKTYYSNFEPDSNSAGAVGTTFSPTRNVPRGEWSALADGTRLDLGDIVQYLGSSFQVTTPHIKGAATAEPQNNSMYTLLASAGPSGESTYTWFAYADSADGTVNFTTDAPNGRTHIGIAYNKSTATEGTNPAEYTWSRYVGPQGPPGEDGVQGPPGEDGQTTYTWIAYANNDTGTSGFSTGSWSGQTHVGIATNKTTPTEGTNPADYTWSLIQGPKGDQGPQGDQGVEGPPGENGEPTYVWFAYADSADGTINFTTGSPGARTYIGIAPNKSVQTEGTNPAEYTWSKYVGPQGPPGEQGIQGPPGENGQPTYTWIAYANNSTGTSGFTTGGWSGQTYVGLAANKTTPTEGTNPADYTWSLIQGPKGDQGPEGTQGVQGPPGEDGQPTYTWFAYADNDTGTSNFTTGAANGRTYIGIAPNKTTQTESTNPADYTWSRYVGEQGPSIVIIPNKVGFVYVDGVLDPEIQTVTYTATLHNIPGGSTINWTTTPNIKTGTGTTFSITSANMANNQEIIVTATVNGISQSVILMKIADPRADPTADNIASSIDGQGSLALQDTADWATQVVGEGRPADFASRGDNLFSNGSLLPDARNWSLTGSIERHASIAGDPVPAFLRFTNTNSSNNTAFPDGQQSSSVMFPVRGGETLYLNWKQRVTQSGGGALTTHYFRWMVYFYSPTGAYIANDSPYTGNAANGIWEDKVRSIIVPSNAAYVKAYPQQINVSTVPLGTEIDIGEMRLARSEAGASYGATWGHNIQDPNNLRPEDRATLSDNLIQNPLFTDKVEPWLLATNQARIVGAVGDPGNFIRDSNTSGSHALGINVGSSTLNRWETMTPIEGGRRIYGAFLFRSNGGSRRIQLILRYRRADQSLSGTTLLFDSGTFDSNGSWRVASFSFVLPQEAVRAQFYILMIGAGNAATLDVTAARIAYNEAGATLGADIHTNVRDSYDGALLTRELLRTPLGTAAGFVGQRALATRDNIGWNLTDITGMPLAIQPGQYYSGTGQLSANNIVYPISGLPNLNALRPAEFLANVTEGRTAGGFDDQAPIATQQDAHNRITRLAVTGRVADPMMYNTSLILGARNTTNISPSYDSSNTSYCTVNIPAHNRIVAGQNGPVTLNYGAGSFTVPYSTVWFAYLDDTDFAGIASPTYNYTTNPNDLLYPGRYLVTRGTTPANSGDTGGGGIGGGGDDECVAADSYLPDGRQACEYVEGDELVVLDYTNTDRITTALVTRNSSAEVPCVEIETLSGIKLVTSTTTPITLRDLSIIEVWDVLGKELPVLDKDGFRWETCIGVKLVGPRKVAHISANHSTYAAGAESGRFILTHNQVVKA